MRYSISSLFKFCIFSFALFGFFACEEANVGSKGEMSVAVTDAPSDDASVKGVFVTVAEVKVDGKSFDGFSGKQTIDLMAYQNGDVKALGLGELAAGSYQEISLVLDYETDDQGNPMGCYVLTTDDQKIDLASSSSNQVELTSRSSFEVVEDAKTEAVIDFDLRKALRYRENTSAGASDRFVFASKSSLEASLRAVNRANSAHVNGKFSATSDTEDKEKIVIYAYEKGTFNQETETNGNGEIMFQNAVTSSTAIESGGEFEYTLAFLEEGDYEVCVVAYDERTDGTLGFEGFLQTSIAIGGSVTSDVSISAGIDATLNLSIIGLIR